MESLQDKCTKIIIKGVMEAPPYLKEILIGKSMDLIKIQSKNEAIFEQTEIINNILPLIVPEIMTDLISSITENVIRPDFYKKYPTIDKFIVKSAIKISETSVRQMEERYVHAAFIIKNNNNYEDVEEYYDVFCF